MEYNEVLTLMYKNYEVLSFSVDFRSYRTTLIKKLEHFDKAPLGVLRNKDSDSIHVSLLRFINHRSIPSSRTDYEEIIKATGMSSGFKLSFQAHGLCLSDHYWFKRKDENYRYEDISFFTNKWDDSFAKALLNQDYEALKHCDLNVPDITTAGWGTKGWICEDDGPKLYKLGINKDHSEEGIGEVLASKIASCIFKEGEYLKYELKKVGDRYASVSPVMLKLDEDLIPLSEFLDSDVYAIYRRKNSDKTAAKQFFDLIKDSEIPGLFEFFVKLSCLRDLCFVSDLHFNNISLIKNSKTGEIRIAPIYDLGGAFGSSRSGQNILSTLDKSTYIMVYYLFSDLDPSWDYSWYNPDNLKGMENTIREYLSKSDFYKPELIDCIIQVYLRQKAVLDETAQKSLTNKL